jgi:hypothetical protein
MPQKLESPCPSGPGAYDVRQLTLYPNTEDLFFEPRGREVTQPGRFTMMVWILPDRHIKDLFGREGNRQFTQEMTCAGDDCHPVTGALYLSESELNDPIFVRYWLYEIFGLSCYRPADAIPEDLVNLEDHCP